MEHNNIFEVELITPTMPEWRLKRVFREFRRLRRMNAILAADEGRAPFDDICYYFQDMFPAFVMARVMEDRGKYEQLEQLVTSDAEDEEVLKVLLSD